eukprot:COSAG02_NODE_9420_length_2222_cov_1.822421_2_plen_249_part_00
MVVADFGSVGVPTTPGFYKDGIPQGWDIYRAGKVPNFLSGTLPPNLDHLTNLKQMNIFSTQLSGTISPSLGNLTSLTNLSLMATQLSGTIPPSLGNLAALTELMIGWSSNPGVPRGSISGTIPASLGNLTALTTYLDLSTNFHLSGTIPLSLGRLTALTSVNLSNTQLSGTIPKSLQCARALTYLELASTRVTGCAAFCKAHQAMNLTHKRPVAHEYSCVTGRCISRRENSPYECVRSTGSDGCKGIV